MLGPLRRREYLAGVIGDPVAFGRQAGRTASSLPLSFSSWNDVNAYLPDGRLRNVKVTGPPDASSGSRPSVRRVENWPRR